MIIHLSGIAVFYAAFSFSALGLNATPVSTDDNAKVQKQFVTNNGTRLVLFNGNEAVWDAKIKDSSKISLAIDGDGSFTLSNQEIKKVAPSEPKAEDYRGKMVQLAGERSPKIMIWLVGADGKRRLVQNQETYECLKGVGYEDPISVSSKILDLLPNIEDAYATCGTNILRPNEALQTRCYLQSGNYKLLLTDRDLIYTANGNQIWASNVGAAQLIYQTDGNLVEYDSEYKAVWASNTYLRSAGMLVLGDNGTLRLYDAKQKQVWEP